MFDTFVKFAFAVLLSLGVLATIVQIDKPRDPITRSTAIFALLFNFSLAAWILLH